MTFQPGIPNASDTLAQSQPDLRTNFIQLNTVFDVDHVPFDDSTVANRGKHDQSTYLDLAVAPVTLMNEVALYSQDVGGNSRLFMSQESAGTAIQLSGADPVTTANGNTFLPGALIMDWGRTSVANNGVVTLASMTTIRQVTFTIEDSSGTSERAYIKAVSTNTFTVTTASGNAVVIRYMAVGV